MPALNPLLIATLVFGFLAAIALLAALASFRERRPGTGLVTTLVGLLFLATSALAGTISVATQGYRALTREVVAATVTTERTGAQAFRATVRLPDNEIAIFELAGDELYVDAHILKWHPVVNILGLHTAYELDRIAGRYSALEDEQVRPRTIYSLSQQKRVNMFHLARRYPLLRPLVDAEYGSATFAPTGQRAMYEVRVSTSGLLLRRLTP
jgi:hypothetical protein